MLVVGGEATPVRSSSQTSSQRAASTSPRSAAGQRRALLPRACASQAQAIRQGCLIAAAPPGSRTGQQQPGALVAAEAAGQQLPAPDGAVRPVAGAVVDRADRRALLAVLGEAGGEVRVVVLHRDLLDALALQRVLGREVLRVQVVGDELRRRPRRGARSARRPRGTSAASRSSRRSPMWWPTQARVALGEAEGALQLGAAGEQRRRRPAAASRLAGT